MSGSAKQILHTTVESILFHKSNLLTTFHNVTSCRGPVITNRFCQPATARVVRQFSWHVLSKQSSCPLITGFSSIRVWVTQPVLGLLDYRQVQTDTERTLDIHPLYKGTRLLFFPPVLNRILPPPQAQTPKVQVRCSEPSIMSRSSLQGRWVPSSIMEEDPPKASSFERG